jgi:hypothetical protein
VNQHQVSRTFVTAVVVLSLDSLLLALRSNLFFCTNAVMGIRHCVFAFNARPSCDSLPVVTVAPRSSKKVNDPMH